MMATQGKIASSPKVSSTTDGVSRRGGAASVPARTLGSFPKGAKGTASMHKNPVQVARRNARERNRVRAVNQGFVKLRDTIPQNTAKAKKLSKVDTLRAAASYIKYLRELLVMPGQQSPSSHDTSKLYDRQSFSSCGFIDDVSTPPAQSYSDELMTACSSHTTVPTSGARNENIDMHSVFDNCGAYSSCPPSRYFASSNDLVMHPHHYQQLAPPPLQPAYQTSGGHFTSMQQLISFKPSPSSGSDSHSDISSNASFEQTHYAMDVKPFASFIDDRVMHDGAYH